MKRVLLIGLLLIGLVGCKNPPRIQGYKANLKCQKELTHGQSESEEFRIDNGKITMHIHLKEFDLFDLTERLNIEEQQAILAPYTEYWPKKDSGQDSISVSVANSVTAEVIFQEGNLAHLRLVTDFQNPESFNEDFVSEYYDALPFHIGKIDNQYRGKDEFQTLANQYESIGYTCEIKELHKEHTP